MPVKSKTVLILAFVIAFVAVKYGMQFYQERQIITKVNQATEKLRQEAREQSPDSPEVIAVEEAAIKKAEENIASKKTSKERLHTASGIFLGFYLVNQRERATYCNEQGVDISPFVKAFEKIHVKEYEIATNAFSYGPSEVNKLYKMLKAQLKLTVVQDMEYLSSENGSSIQETCELVSDNADMLVPGMHISVLQPAVYKALISEF